MSDLHSYQSGNPAWILVTMEARNMVPTVCMVNKLDETDICVVNMCVVIELHLSKGTLVVVGSCTRVAENKDKYDRYQ